MADLKTFTPIVIEDAAFPNSTAAVDQIVTQSTAGGISKPKESKDESFPSKKIATEVLSTALNTRSKKILKEFQFTQSGALQIGTYEGGVTGDLRISPDGIVARNMAGENTFILDGETGNAYFAGTIQAGTLIGGAVSVGNGDILIDGANNRMVFFNEDDTIGVQIDKDGILVNGGKITIHNADNDITLDERGVVSSKNFSNVDNNYDSVNFHINSNSETDVTSSSDSFSLLYTTVMLFVAHIDLYPNTWTASDYCINRINLYVDDVIVGFGYFGQRGSATFGIPMTSITLSGFKSLASGNHTVKLTAYRDNDLQTVVGSPDMIIFNTHINYMAIGPGMTV